MGFIAPFVPAIVSGVGAWLGRNKGGPNKAAQANITAQTGNAQQAGQQANALTAYGTPLLQQSSNYYSRLLTGDHAAMASALAPEISATNATYSGAERGLDRTGAQGAARDVAKAQLNRERAGRVSSLFPAARQAAAQATGQAGQFGINAGQAARGQSGSLYESLLNGERADRNIGLQQQGDFGQSIGGLLAQVMQGQSSKKGSGAGGGSSLSATFGSGLNPGLITQ